MLRRSAYRRSSTKGLPSPGKDHSCGIHVPVQRQATVGTSVSPNAKIFGGKLSTRATLLRRIAWVYLHNLFAGALSLAFEDRDKGAPRDVVDLFSEPASGQPFDVQVFDNDRIEALDKVQRDLVMEIGALPALAVASLGARRAT